MVSKICQRLNEGEEAELGGELGIGEGNTASAGESRSLKSCLGRHAIAFEKSFYKKITISPHVLISARAVHILITSIGLFQ